MYTASRESNLELSMLVSDFMVTSMLKNTQRYLECIEGLNEYTKKKNKKGQILYITGRDNQNTTKFDIMHESYGFNADLLKAIN